MQIYIHIDYPKNVSTTLHIDIFKNVDCAYYLDRLVWLCRMKLKIEYWYFIVKVINSLGINLETFGAFNKLNMHNNYKKNQERG